jgi:dATP pyrophosphohydrolase
MAFCGVDVHVFKRGGPRPLFLVLRRAGHVAYARLWRMVTGDIAQGETAVQAALRALREETSLTPTGLWAPGYVHSYYDPDTDTVCLQPVFSVEVDDTAVTLDAEHDSYRWIELEQAHDLLTWPGHRDGLHHTHDEVVISRERASRFQVSLNGLI